MPKSTIYTLLVIVLCSTFSCTRHPSKLEQMRQEKAQKDSLQYEQAKQNLRYSDSVLILTQDQVDPILKSFVYSKHPQAEDHGHYVHQSLQTSSHPSRNFLQAYVSDNRQISLQSYYYGGQQLKQRTLCLQAGDDYVQKEGSNHAFQAEGWHEIMTIEGEDALQLLAFISHHTSERIQVKLTGQQSVTYSLSSKEKEALAETYQLGILMRNIDALERAIHVANLQIQKYEKKRDNCK